MRSLFYCDSPDKEQLRLRGKQCTAASGIGDLLEGVDVDESMFYPCGYSMNGVKVRPCVVSFFFCLLIFVKKDRNYYTIHVTPQPQCSYASFETNCRYENYDLVVSKLVSIFKPGRFIVNVTSQYAAPKISKQVDGFLRRDWVEYDFNQFSLSMGTRKKKRLYLF
jgi:S-adenosylmethionine decarboxylase